MDDPKRRKLEGTVKTLYQCFKSHEARGDSAFYVRPELGWELLEVAKDALQAAPPSEAADPEVEDLRGRLRRLESALSRLWCPVTGMWFHDVVDLFGEPVVTFGTPERHHTRPHYDDEGNMFLIVRNHGIWSNDFEQTEMHIIEDGDICDLLEQLDDETVALVERWLTESNKKRAGSPTTCAPGPAPAAEAPPRLEYLDLTSPPSFETQNDLYGAMGIVLGIIDDIRRTRIVDVDISPNDALRYLATLIDGVAARLFQEDWEPFKRAIRQQFPEAHTTSKE